MTTSLKCKCKRTGGGGRSEFHTEDGQGGSKPNTPTGAAGEDRPGIACAVKQGSSYPHFAGEHPAFKGCVTVRLGRPGSALPAPAAPSQPRRPDVPQSPSPPQSPVKLPNSAGPLWQQATPRAASWKSGGEGQRDSLTELKHGTALEGIQERTRFPEGSCLGCVCAAFDESTYPMRLLPAPGAPVHSGAASGFEGVPGGRLGDA